MALCSCRVDGREDHGQRAGPDHIYHERDGRGDRASNPPFLHVRRPSRRDRVEPDAAGLLPARRVGPRDRPYRERLPPLRRGRARCGRPDHRLARGGHRPPRDPAAPSPGGPAMSDVHLSSRPIQDVEVPVTGRYRSLGLDRNPFVGSGPLVDLPGQQSALAEIRGWVDAVSADRARDDRLAVLTGEPGMGRSRLLREIAGEASAPVIDPGKGNLTDAPLLRAMVDAFGGAATGRTGQDLRRATRLALADLPAGTAPGLLIDDADFTGSRLELIRNVLRDGAEHGLWIVIAGQPDLADRVERRRSLKAILGPLARVS